MGGRGAMMNKGFSEYKYETVKVVSGIKVIERKDKKGSFSMPDMSNTPSTRYIQVSKDSKTAMLRIYGADRMKTMDYAYGQHEGIKQFHVHEYQDGVEIIRKMTDEEIKKYGKLFYKAGFRP